MTTFEEALKTSLLGLTDGFKIADSELHQEVASASEGLSKLSNGAAKLQLNVAGESPQGMFYSLQLLGTNLSVNLVPMFVPARGYPITLGNPPPPGAKNEMKNRQEIAAFLADMAANPDSSLVQHLAFLMRRKQS